MIHRAPPSLLQLFLQFVNHPTYNHKDSYYHYHDCPASHVNAEFLPLCEFLFDRVRYFHLLGYRNLFRRQVHRVGLCLHLCQQVPQAIDGNLRLCVLAVGDVQPCQYDLTILVALQQCPDSSAVRRQLDFHQLLHHHTVGLALHRNVLGPA